MHHLLFLKNRYYLYKGKRHAKIFAIAIVLFAGLFYGAYAKAPETFPSGELISVESGSSVQVVAEDFREKGIIRAPRLFSVLIRLLAPERGVVAGEYSFPEPLSIFGIVRRVTDPDYGLSLLRVTIQEGLNNREIAEVLEKKIAHFNTKEFLRLAKNHEGYLFPDTYFLTKSTSARAVFDLMRDTFDERTAELSEKIAATERSPEDILIMASLLEKEARTLESKKKIAGILWKRLDDGMPLQVDATFLYFLGKNTFELTLEDLKYDSPYNTYRYKGLPPGPIGNPGLSSIRAAAEPVGSPYWFYLSDKLGNFHFAVTFDEHKMNKQVYLR